MTESATTYRTNPLPMRLTLTGAVVPKARPRVTGHIAYMPERYVEWQSEAVAELCMQIPPGFGSLTRAAVEITLLGKHPKRGDLDNIAGSVLDALVKAWILPDDNVNVVYRLSVEFRPDKQPPMVEILLP